VPGAVAVSIIVFGRGLVAESTGFRLTGQSAERVEALVGYVRQNAAVFTARRGRIVFSGGWAGAADGVGPPPRQFREGSLMLDQAMAADIGGANLASYADVYPETESDSTLENALRVKEDGYFDGTAFTAHHPLGLVAHREHLKRINYLVRRAFGLPGEATVNIAAPGTDARSGGLPESVLLPLTRLAFLGAGDHSSLRRRHRMLVAWNHRLRALPKQRWPLCSDAPLPAAGMVHQERLQPNGHAAQPHRHRRLGIGVLPVSATAALWFAAELRARLLFELSSFRSAVAAHGLRR
jgi:hypothetical protein